MDQNEIREIIRETLDLHTQEIDAANKKDRLFEWCKIALMPLSITIISVLASIFLDNQKSSLLKSQAEQQSIQTEKIANLAKETIEDIFNRQHETQYLSQIKDIYLGIVTSENPKNNQQLMTQIKSLEAYKTSSIPFLVNLSQYYNELDDKDLRIKITESIRSILKGSQPNIPYMAFGDGSENQMMRYANFKNYDLSGFEFKFCNLFSSSFSKSILSGAQFINSDLNRSDFTQATLIGATFKKSDLKNASFLGANLGKNLEKKENITKFINCELDGAHFDFEFLWDEINSKSANPDFSDVTTKTKITLLARHVERMEALILNNDGKLKELLKEFKMDSEKFLKTIKDYNLEKRKKQ